MINITAIQESLINHGQHGCLVTSRCCWPKAADEEWYYLKRPSSAVAVQCSDLYAEMSTILL